jgi:hypothetical protein
MKEIQKLRNDIRLLFNGKKNVNTTPSAFMVVCSDEITALEVNTNTRTFSSPFNFKLESVEISLTVPQTGGTVLTVDVFKNEVSILTTKVTITNGEYDSSTSIKPIINFPFFEKNDKIRIAITQVGDGTAMGLKTNLIGKI